MPIGLTEALSFIKTRGFSKERPLDFFQKSKNKENMFTLDFSLDNETLYKGCDVHRHPPKRPRLISTMTESYDTIKKNVAKIFLSKGFSPDRKGDSILLTGSMLNWSFGAVLVVAMLFFEDIYLSDGNTKKLLYSSKGGPEDLKPSSQ
jgi:hypothetical protein